MAAAQSQNALWGEKSLSERFGGLTGRALQDQIFGIYQAIVVWISLIAASDLSDVYNLSVCICRSPCVRFQSARTASC